MSSRTGHVEFGSSISCFGSPWATPYATSVQAQLWDRTPGYDGMLLAAGPTNAGTSASSSGAIDLYDVDYYPAAQWVEQVLVVTVSAPPGWVWDHCNAPDGARILWCIGLGTTQLDAGVGFSPFATGVSALPFGCSVEPQLVNYRSSPGGAIIIAGTGFVSCNQKADISIRVTLYRRDFPGGGAWVKMTESNTVNYPNVPRGTVKVNSTSDSCNEAQPDGEWRVEVYGKGVYHGFFGDTTDEKTVGHTGQGVVDC